MRPIRSTRSSSVGASGPESKCAVMNVRNPAASPLLKTSEKRLLAASIETRALVLPPEVDCCFA